MALKKISELPAANVSDITFNDTLVINDGSTTKRVTLSNLFEGYSPIQISDTAPTTSVSGQLWWDSTTGSLYVFYNDGDSSQWVPAVSGLNITIPENSITTVELNVDGVGTNGQALLSNGDGSFSWGSSGGGATIADDDSTDSTFYPTMSSSDSGSFTTATVSSTKLYFNPSTGVLNAVQFNSLSDESLKENITDIENGLDIINQIRPVSFEWKDTGEKSYGVIAQEIEQIIPEIVSTNSDGIKSVSYDKIIAFLIDAVQKLETELHEQKNLSGDQ